MEAESISAERLSFRQSVNRWIRTSGTFEAALNFDALARDLHDPTRIRPDFGAGDRLHPNDSGYKAKADSKSTFRYSGARWKQLQPPDHGADVTLRSC